MNPFLSLLLGLSLSGTLLALLLMLLRRLAGSRLPSAFYYFAWLLVLLRFVLPVPGLLPGFAASTAASFPLPALVSEADGTDIRYYREDFARPGAAAEAPDLASAPVITGEAVSTPFDGQSLSAQRLFDLVQALRSVRFWLSVWVIGMLVSAVWYLSGYIRFRRELKRTLIPATDTDRAVYKRVTDEPCPRLFRSQAVSTPMLLGVLHAMIILPDKEFSETMLQGILAHELTHHRRGDVLVKWLSVLVSILHWFNPVTRLFRSELDRSCELACDERLLRHMDAGEKQLYGDMLISLAADRRLPRSVVATSFAVEKRNLKERLVQIMTYKRRSRAGICLALAALLLLSACGFAVGPAVFARSQTLAAAAVPTAAPQENKDPLPTPENPGGYKEVTVDNIDDLLAAIADNTMIFLKPGTYDLSAAKTYGQDMGAAAYTWQNAYDGYELVIRDVNGLVIAGLPGENGDPIVISAVPRYAQVIRFELCQNLILSAFTAGHTQEPGQCAGGVLYFDSCVNTQITGCNLYGCGVLGIQAVNCDSLRADDCSIYDCSSGAVSSRGSRDIRLVGCEIYNCGNKNGRASSLFEVGTSTGFAVINCYVHENNAVRLLRSTSADEIYLLGTQVSGNQFDSLFISNLIPPVVGGCSFQGNRIEGQIREDTIDYVLSPEGEKLLASDLDSMTLDRSAYEYEGPAVKQTAAVNGIPAQDGMEYHVTTVDEFLSCIGSNTTIYLDAELFDFSTASSYGGYGGDHFYWVDIFDGPGLVITGVENLRIIGQGKDKTTVEAVPRYADVLCFESCTNVTVASLTAGHTKGEPGSCTGDVLAFEQCRDVHVVDCGLFGCGVWGIRANNCVQGDILRTEIYECSSGAAVILRTDGFVFTDCSVHDCAGKDWGSDKMSPCNIISMADSGDCSYNGVPLQNGVFRVGDGEAVTPMTESSDTAIPYAPAPTPEPGNTDASLHLFFYETEIKSDGFTMHLDDEPIPLRAFVLFDGSYLVSEFQWSVNDPSTIALTPSENGISCELKPLTITEKGGTILTVSSPADGLTLRIPVYVKD